MFLSHTCISLGSIEGFVDPTSTQLESCDAATFLARLMTVLGPAPHAPGLTLVHFSAQPEPFLWDGGCI
jgi:hypothetical protein